MPYPQVYHKLSVVCERARDGADWVNSTLLFELPCWCNKENLLSEGGGGGGEEAILGFNGFCRFLVLTFPTQTSQILYFQYTCNTCFSFWITYSSESVFFLSLWICWAHLNHRALVSGRKGWSEGCLYVGWDGRLHWGNKGSGGQRLWDLLVIHYSRQEIKELFALLLYHLFPSSNPTTPLSVHLCRPNDYSR